MIPQSQKIAIARKLRRQDTWAEKVLWKWLRDRRFSEYKFRRQYPYGEFILDFFCLEAMVDIELDGRQHGYPEQKREEEKRDAWLEARGIKVLRFWNSQLRQNQQSIRDTIWNVLHERAPQPQPDYWRKNIDEGIAKNTNEGET